MRYKIHDCVVCGISNPKLIFRGWIESNATEFIIRGNGKKFHCEKFSLTRSEVHKIDINVKLEKGNKINKYELIGIVEDQEIIFETVTTNALKRLKQKIAPKNKKFFFNNNNIKVNYLNTLEMANDRDYRAWIKKHESFSAVEDFKYQPLISIVMPVYNVEGKYLSFCIDSILNQTYHNFEICIADDCSTNEDTIETLKRYEKQDKRIKVVFRETNGHISEATNSALELATGEFVGLMDNDDMLVKHALNEMVAVLNRNKELDLIYTDEDKIDLDGNRSDPHFKSDFAINTFYGGNYVCHFTLIRTKIISNIGKFRKGYEGAQDFDLFLRITDQTNKIYHIPKILYHWRMIPGSTALDSKSKNYAGEAGKRALTDLFSKKGIDVHVDVLVNTHYFVEYILHKEEKVTIFVDCRKVNNEFEDKLKYMCENLVYSNFKFALFVDEKQTDKILTKEFINQYEKHIMIVKLNQGYIEDVNKFIKEDDSSYLAFLNCRYVIDNFDALDIMVGYASQFSAGVVGCKVINNENFVKESGILFDSKGFPFSSMVCTYKNDYGFYGRLLVPANYRAVEDKFFLLSAKKFKESGGLESSIQFKYSVYLMCITLPDQYAYNNVILPTIEVKEFNKVKDEINDGSENFRERCKKDNYKDKFYNENLSKKVAYRLPG